MTAWYNTAYIDAYYQKAWKAREEWYDTSMIVYMLTYLNDNQELLFPPEAEFEEFWGFIHWIEDVDMRTGAFGR